jgi:transposase
LCDEHQLHPTVLYRRVKQFFDNGGAAFGPAARTDKQVEPRGLRIASLETKLKKKGEVLAELMEEHMALKKFREIRMWLDSLSLRKADAPPSAPRHGAQK